MSTTITIKTGFKSEFSPVQKSVSITFVSEGQEDTIINPDSIVEFKKEILPESIKASVPDAPLVAKVAKAREYKTFVEEVKSFLTKADHGNYVVTIKASVFAAFEAFVKSCRYNIERMTEKSIVALVAMLDRAFRKSFEFEGV